MLHKGEYPLIITADYVSLRDGGRNNLQVWPGIMKSVSVASTDFWKRRRRVSTVNLPCISSFTLSNPSTEAGKSEIQRPQLVRIIMLTMIDDARIIKTERGLETAI